MSSWGTLPRERMHSHSSEGSVVNCIVGGTTEELMSNEPKRCRCERRQGMLRRTYNRATRSTSQMRSCDSGDCSGQQGPELIHKANLEEKCTQGARSALHGTHTCVDARSRGGVLFCAQVVFLRWSSLSAQRSVVWVFFSRSRVLQRFSAALFGMGPVILQRLEKSDDNVEVMLFTDIAYTLPEQLRTRTRSVSRRLLRRLFSLKLCDAVVGLIIESFSSCGREQLLQSRAGVLSSSQELITEFFPWVPGRVRRVMCFMEGQGVDGHVGDFFCFFCVYLLSRWFEMVLTRCDPRAVL